MTHSFVKLCKVNVSLWYRPCYKYMLTWQRQQMPKNYDKIKADFLCCKADTEFHFGH